MAATYYNNRAAAYTMLKAYAQAAQDCRRALERDPTLTKALMRAGKCYLALGNVGEAVRCFRGVLDVDAEDATALTELRNAERAGKLVEMAREAVRSADYKRALFNIDQAATLATGGSGCPAPWNLLKAEAMIAARTFDDANILLKCVAD
jgi:tetratricopeptide (TPR) repeat protein